MILICSIRVKSERLNQKIVRYDSVFIVDYMKLNPEVKAMYDNIELPRRFATACMRMQ